jgi:hypothetical protein
MTEDQDMKLSTEKEAGQEHESADGNDDTEGMDSKAKALMHLLKTSSVCLPPIIVSDHSLTFVCLRVGVCGYHVRKDEEAARGSPHGSDQAAASSP